MWKDYIKEDWFNFNFHEVPMNIYDHPDLDWDIIEYYQKKFYRQFYLRPSYILRRLRSAIADGTLFVQFKTAWRMEW
jgi:hypothetical protein